MSADLFFDNFEHMPEEERLPDPIYTVDFKDEEALLDWLTKEYQRLKNLSVDRFRRIRQNLALYRGDSARFRRSRSTTSRSHEGIPVTRHYRLTANHLFDLTATKVSTITKIKPAVEILPTNNELDDKNSAKASKKFIDHLWDINDVDKLLQDVHLAKYIAGETYIFTEWDPDKGDLHPDYIEATRNGEVLEFTNESGNPVLNEDGTRKTIDAPVRTGDISYEIENAWRVFPENKESWSKVNYVFRVELAHIEELKRDFPDKKDKITELKNTKVFDPNLMEDRPLNSETLKITLYHKKTKHVPEGLQIVFTPDVILDKSDSKYSMDEMPVIRITDIDFPGILHGMSFYEHAKNLQAMHNNLTSMIAKNQFLTAHPKWFLPQGSANINSLGNDVTVVPFKGRTAPALVQMNPTPAEVFGFRDTVKEEMEQISGVAGVSRGQPPSGVTAAVAMEFLEEQEQVRGSTEISKHFKLIRDLAKMSLAIAGDYYDEEDGRTIRILGKDGKHLIRSLDVASLHRNYDIRINASSALAGSKSAKTARILQALQFGRELLPPEQWVDLLDLGSEDKMTTMITAALDHAESENESFFEGDPVMPPSEEEDHIIHWRTHLKRMQTRSYKEDLSPEQKAEFKRHLEIHEMEMDRKAQKNPLFMAKLAQLAQYPIVYALAVTPISAAQQEAIVQGAANRGEPTDATIPATEPDKFPEEAVERTSKK